jgi:hypothetical protein
MLVPGDLIAPGAISAPVPAAGWIWAGYLRQKRDLYNALSALTHLGPCWISYVSFNTLLEP